MGISKLLISTVISLIFTLPITVNAEVIDGFQSDGSKAFYGTGRVSYPAIGESFITSVWYEDNFMITGLIISGFNGSSPDIVGGGSFGSNCSLTSSSARCTMTKTDFAQTEGVNVGVGPGAIIGFAIRVLDGTSFSLNSASLFPNGFTPHMPGYSQADTALFIGDTFDETRPLSETMDTYSLGALWESNDYFDLDFGNAYQEVEQLFVFSTTDVFWNGIDVTHSFDMPPAPVSAPAILACALMPIIMTFRRRRLGLRCF